MRYFRLPSGLTYYAVDRVCVEGRYHAVSAIGIRRLGRPVRLELQSEILAALVPVAAEQVPEAWMDLFRTYFWRERARTSKVL